MRSRIISGMWSIGNESITVDMPISIHSIIIYSRSVSISIPHFGGIIYYGSLNIQFKIDGI